MAAQCLLTEPGGLLTTRLGTPRPLSEDSQCAGLRSRGPLRTVQDHFHKIKVGDEVKRPIWKLAHPAELAIYAYDPANLHRVWDARIQLVKDGSGVTEPRINVAELEYRPRRHGRAWNRGIGDIVSGCDSSGTSTTIREAGIVWKRIDRIKAKRRLVDSRARRAGRSPAALRKTRDRGSEKRQNG